MISLLCLIIPSILFATFYKILSEELTWQKFLTAFSIQSIFSNIITFLVLSYVSGKEYVMVLDASPMSTVLKVLVLSLISNLIVYIVCINVCKKFNFTLKWISSEKKG